MFGSLDIIQQDDYLNTMQFKLQILNLNKKEGKKERNEVIDPTRVSDSV
jgi:hypothetical protein